MSSTHGTAPDASEAGEPMSAADRFTRASRDRDVARAGRELADEVTLFNPMSAEPLVGRDAVLTALATLDAVFDVFHHVAVLVAAPGDQAGTAQAIRFHAEFGGHVIDGVDLLEVDSHDQIAAITVLARPMSELQFLGQAIAAQLRDGRPAPQA